MSMSTQIHAQVSIDAPFEQVVAALSQFDGLADWHPGFEGCEVEGEGKGAVRTYRLGDTTIRDRLDDVDEEGRGYRYTQLEGPIEAEKHRGYLWIRRDDDGRAAVEWSARISSPTLPEELVSVILGGLFEAGLLAAKTRLENPE